MGLYIKDEEIKENLRIIYLGKIVLKVPLPTLPHCQGEGYE